MKNKWSSENVKRTQLWLIEQWPTLFTPGPDLKPLSLNIHKEILLFRDQNPDLSTRVLQEALKRHTTSFGYLYGMTKSTHRHNLKGEPVEEITAENRSWAHKTLRVMQKLTQKTNKSKALARKINQAPAQDRKLKSIASAPNARTAQIRYKRPRRNVVVPTSSPALGQTPDALAS